MQNSFWDILSFLSNTTRLVSYIRPSVESGIETTINQAAEIGLLNPITQNIKVNCGLFTCDEITKTIGYELTDNAAAYIPYIGAAAATVVTLYALKKCCWDSSAPKEGRIVWMRDVDENTSAQIVPHWDRGPKEGRIVIHRIDGSIIDVSENVDPNKLKRILRVI